MGDFGVELEVLLEVVSQGGHDELFVGISDAFGGDFLHGHVLGEHAEDGLHGSVPLAFVVLSLGAVDSCYSSLGFLEVISNRESFLGIIANAPDLEWTAFAVSTSGCILLFERSFFLEYFSEPGFFVVWAEVVLLFFLSLRIMNEVVRSTLEGAMRGNVGIDASLFHIGGIVTTSIVGICKDILHKKSLLSKSSYQWVDNAYEATTVVFVSKIGLDGGDHVMVGIDGHLAVIVEFTSLSRLYTDACVGISGAVMGVIRGIFGVFAFGPGSIFLSLIPVLLPVINGLEFTFGGCKSLLFF